MTGILLMGVVALWVVIVSWLVRKAGGVLPTLRLSSHNFR